MSAFRLIAVLGLLSASGANAAGLPMPSDGFTAERLLQHVADDGQKEPGWTKLCFDVPNTEPEEKGQLAHDADRKGSTIACFTYAELRARQIYIRPKLPEEPESVSLGHLGVLQMQGTGRSYVVAIFPLDANPWELDIWVDGIAQLKLGYPEPACDTAGCFARAEIPQAFLERIKMAKSISLGAQSVWRHYGSIPLPCCSFGAALDSAPVPIEAQSGMQRKMGASIRQLSVYFAR
jgi:hypothetical protein